MTKAPSLFTTLVLPWFGIFFVVFGAFYFGIKKDEMLLELQAYWHSHVSNLFGDVPLWTSDLILSLVCIILGGALIAFGVRAALQK